MAVNVKSCFLASKYVIAQMLKQETLVSGDRGWIINISSVLGLVGGYNVCKSFLTVSTRTTSLTSFFSPKKQVMLPPKAPSPT